ncbi:MAG: amidase [Betaproteobacteria bacterium]|nr:amidase [Betaproteobacteria bacterium]
MNELCFESARRLARLIRTRKVSSSEVVKAHIAQTEGVNPAVNAIVTFLPEQALREAKRVDAQLARKRSAGTPGPLAGLPIAYKDMVDTAGIRTTYGSPIYRDHVPARDALLVERLKAAGAITLGKTNTPEFAAGSQTFNPVFGATLNPYDTTKTCGGSSGGAAVAVACGMLPFADGSDLGASLRNPGNFCNVVGFRPTPGRVPMYPAGNIWAPLSVMGPLARTVEDTAFLLSAMAGPDLRAPLSIAEPGGSLSRPLGREFKRVRIAWSRDLGGLPVDAGVAKALEAQRRVFASLGCVIEDAEPDLSGADEAFQTLRALGFVEKYGELLKTRRAQIKDTVIWNIEEGLKLTPERIARANMLRTQVYQRMREFLERYEFLVLPVNQVPPFPVTQPYVTEINGVKLANYIDWMKTCYLITVTTHPAISVPAGFTGEGLPVGIQIVGRYRDDFGVLQIAHAFEQATLAWRRRPPVLG